MWSIAANTKGAWPFRIAEDRIDELANSTSHCQIGYRLPQSFTTCGSIQCGINPNIQDLQICIQKCRDVPGCGAIEYVAEGYYRGGCSLFSACVPYLPPDNDGSKVIIAANMWGAPPLPWL